MLPSFSLGVFPMKKRRVRNLTAYDAAYLEAALRESIALPTVDEQLHRAASAEGLAVL
jgi:predicted nucleic acid-binding protein